MRRAYFYSSNSFSGTAFIVETPCTLDRGNIPVLMNRRGSRHEPKPSRPPGFVLHHVSIESATISIRFREYDLDSHATRQPEQ